MSLDRTLQRVWYEQRPFALFLLLTPLSVVFRAVSAIRRFAFRWQWLRMERVSTPVLVVGNVSVGGTGKTPLVIWIAQRLLARDLKVGIITRGYGGSAAHWPQDVTCDSDATLVGDEAVLLAARTNAIVVAGPDRVADAKRAIERGAQVIVSDDGLQHYRLARSAEIVVIDSERRFGNGWLLPAGPLREPISRAQRADLIVMSLRGSSLVDSSPHYATARHVLREAINLVTGERRPLAELAGRHVHAIAGIGNPDAFFAMLRAEGLSVVPHAFADHAALQPRDVSFEDDWPVLMTEKDAVKCRAFAGPHHWAIPLAVTFDASDEAKLVSLLDRLVAAATSIAR